MWQRNPDTGKWFLQVDQLPKDNYEKLKQDFESVKLYSRCLSGATYIMIDDFNNIYNTLEIDEIGYYIENSYSQRNLPPRGPVLSLDVTNSDKFYQKYLKENAFTIKNLFTPNKLIDDESSNLITVDVSTTEPITNIGIYSPVVYIDGLRLLEGHKILVKNQVTSITLSNDISPEDYFTNVNLVSNYYVVDTNSIETTYNYYNEQNGIYKYTSGFLVKQTDISNYNSAYKCAVVVSYGNINNDKQFHLLRLRNNYFPIEGENVEFEEKHNWVLRHRFDYNNVLELNHYDILKSDATTVYSETENFTYSIPSRLIAVGEFGTIINNQDQLTPSATYSNSTIINSKYKVNLRSISETNDYYWICGDEGTFLKVWKPDFSIERVDLGTFATLTCVTFYDELNGFVVGKFNRIYFTTDGGFNWTQLDYVDFEPYSYNKIKFVDSNKAFVVGTTGLFLELTKSNNTWIAYKRKIYKTIEEDNLDLVDDLYDLMPFKWSTFKPFEFVNNSSSTDFADSLKFNFKISESNYPTLQIDISTKYLINQNFKNSEFVVGLLIENSIGIVYEDLNTYSLYQQGTDTQFQKLIYLPTDDDGKLIKDKYFVTLTIEYNYEGATNTVLENFESQIFYTEFVCDGGDLYLLTSDDKIIVYDLNRKFYDYDNDFIYYEFDQTIGDIRSIVKSTVEDNLFYIGADRIYSFDFSDFSNLPVPTDNYVIGKLNTGPNLYVNRLLSDDKLYLSGNESLLKSMIFGSFSSSNLGDFWDPTFKDKFKPKLLFLDYDISSKLNFFTDLGQYRMPESTSITKDSLTYDPAKNLRPKFIQIFSPFSSTYCPLPGDFLVNFNPAVSEDGELPSSTSRFGFRYDDVQSNDIREWLDILTSSTNLIKGYLKVQNRKDKSKFLIYRINSLVSNNTTTSPYFRVLNVTFESDSGNIGSGGWSEIVQFNNGSIPVFFSETLPFPPTETKVSFNSLDNQTSWIDYYKDSEKTFEYYTSIEESKKVEYSCTFSYLPTINDFVVSNVKISNNLSDISKFAPSLTDSKNSDFFANLPAILTSTSGLVTQPTTLSTNDLMIYKNLIIFKRGFNDTIEVGDIIRLESDVVDCNLVVNKISYYYKLSGGPFNKITELPFALAPNSVFEKYVYCFHSLNQNIVNNLIVSSGNLNFKNLNKYNSVSDFIDKFQNHPLNIAYKIEESDDHVTFSGRFNNKTAYYNLACQIQTIISTTEMNYTESFLTFGFSPTYNILDSLNKLNSEYFTPNKKFCILPEYTSIPSATNSIYLDSSVIVDGKTNKLLFSENFKFQWDSILIWTFVDVVVYNNDDESKINSRLLVINKYYDSDNGSYVIELHKKVSCPSLTPGIKMIDILSRNTLSQISEDLQVLNNIQRSQSEKSVNSEDFFTTYEPDVKFKFPTESYMKALVCDFDIQQKVTGIVYSDYNYQISFNILNVEKEVVYEFNSTKLNHGGSFSDKVTYELTTLPQDEFKVGDLIYVELLGDLGSSKYLNPEYQGVQTVIDIDGNFITTSKQYGVDSTTQDVGTIRFLKRDEFLNYIPIDLFDIAKEKKPKNSIEILPEMVQLSGQIYSLVNVDVSKYKIRLLDGLFLQEIESNYSWLLQAEVSDAIIGKNDNGIVWYNGIWRCGRWFNGTWVSGEWLGGDWYNGIWSSSAIQTQITSVEINQSFPTLNLFSKWQGGRWFGGTWNGGTWYDGRRYGGDWMDGVWFNGIWNDGNWYGGKFQGGIWVYGNWYGGALNCDTKPSYWLDGNFEAGDFENGIWYNGQFGNDRNEVARFGTRSVNTRISVWNGGKWISGEFHSFLNIDENTGETLVSDVHTLSVWKTGLWLGGDFYGGIAYNIDFRGGTWYGGISEEIQISGVAPIYPPETSSNMIRIRGLFKFNSGDEIYIIDDSKNTEFSPIGNNTNIGKYRINRIYEDTTTNQTEVYLNYNLADLPTPVSELIGNENWSNIETGLRIVNHFIESKWKSGLWTNGYFESGAFESGIWFNGIFEGNLGQ